MRRVSFLVCLLFLTSAQAAEVVDYDRDVVPILERYCIGCHSRDDAEAELILESYSSLMTGGKSGAVITPGATGSSRLWLMLNGQREPVMPPEGEARPNELELKTLAEWIEQGARGPSGEETLKRVLRTPRIPPHSDVVQPITAMAASSDGTTLALARFGKIELRRIDGAVLRTIPTDVGKVTSLELTRDETQLLVGSGLAGAYGGATFLSMQTGEPLQEFIGHRDLVYAAVLSPDESIIATAGYDREIVLWDADTGEELRRLVGHHGAVYSLAFSSDGKVLVSGSADETAKVWHVPTGERFDTLSQPEGEVLVVRFSPDGNLILAGSSDNRLRIWRFESREQPAINPLLVTRFVDETPLIDFDFTPDGKSLVVLSRAGQLKVLSTSDWSQQAVLQPLTDVGSGLRIRHDGSAVDVSLMNGQVVTRAMPPVRTEAERPDEMLEPIYLDLGPLSSIAEPEAEHEGQIAGDRRSAARLVPRGAEITGHLNVAGESDFYRWSVNRGEVWAIDADAIDGSPLDPLIAILDSDGQPVLRVRLQAVRDSYFTFRGKDSLQNDDFRMFNWQEMGLGDYLYASGEVTRLWMHPRGPDSGFKVFPGEGERWTYFGTTAATHALSEPAYIVRPLAAGARPIANGLPVFDLYYENDDDMTRLAGRNSRLLFTAPEDDVYVVRLTDTRGQGGDDYRYRLTIRAAEPAFRPSVEPVTKPLRKGTGREFLVHVDRLDGFEGPVEFDIPELPEQLSANVPLTIEAGQRTAVGTIWANDGESPWPNALSPQIVARAMIHGRRVERVVGTIGDLTLEDTPRVIPVLQPIDRELPEGLDWTLQVRRGSTVSARVVLHRQEGFDDEVPFGNETSGRNTAHGVYVDNIGLNGLLVLSGDNQREFFLTADPIAEPGKRSFFLTANVDGGVTTLPITVEVLPD